MASSKSKKHKKLKVNSEPDLSPTIAISVIWIAHTLISSFTYFIANAYLSYSKLPFENLEHLPLPTAGQMALFYFFVANLVVCVLLSYGFKSLYSQNFNLHTKTSIKQFVSFNIVPIFVLLIIIYLIFDPLITIAVGLAFLVFLIYFGQD